MPETRNGHVAWQTLICGGLAGVAAKTIIAPFDRVKIHFQVQNPALVSYTGRLTGVFEALTTIYRNTGFSGLYRGHSAMIVRIFPYAAINFYSYEFFKDALYQHQRPENVVWWRRILAGSLSGAIAVTATYPLDIIRARLAFDLTRRSPQNRLTVKQLSHSYFKTTGLVLSSLVREGKQAKGNPVAGFYQGYLATLAGIFPYAGVSYFSFETMKMLYRRNLPDHDAKIPVLIKLPMGMIAGALAQTAAYPLDVVRRRAQVLRVAPHLRSMHEKDRLSPRKMLATIIRHGGWRGLFLGLSINYLKVAPATGISFVIYEFLRENIFHLPVG